MTDTTLSTAVSSSLEFRPIVLPDHGESCVDIRAETFRVSFGSDDLFWQEAGPHGEFYLAALAERMRWQPNSCVHAWLQDRMAGMLELKPYGKDPTIGYINTFYLFPDVRGAGWAVILEEYCRTFFRSLGMLRMRLTVSPQNMQAIRYYQRHRWQYLQDIPLSCGWLRHYNTGVPGSAPHLKTAIEEAKEVLEKESERHVWLMEKA